MMNKIKCILSLCFFFCFAVLSAQEGTTIRGYLQLANEETQTMDTIKGAVHLGGEFYLFTLRDANSNEVVQDYLLKISATSSVENSAFEFSGVKVGSYKISVTEFGKSETFKNAVTGEMHVQVEADNEYRDVLLPITKKDEAVLGFYWYSDQFQLNGHPIEKYELKNFVISVYDSNHVFLSRSLVYEDWDGGDFVCLLGGVPFQNKLHFKIEKIKNENADAYTPLSLVYSPDAAQWKAYTESNQGFTYHFLDILNLMALPYLSGVIAYDENLSELPTIAKIEIENTNRQTTQTFYTESHTPGRFNIQLQKGSYDITVYAQGAKTKILNKKIEGDEAGFNIILEDDNKSAFVAVSPTQENGEPFYASISYMYSFDKGLNWNAFPDIVNSKHQKCLHYYGDGDIRIKADAGENYLLDSVNLSRTDYALKYPNSYVWNNVVTGRVDTIYVQGLTAYQYYNEFYELVTVAVPNVTVELLDEASEYGEPILTIESDHEGRFNIKFLGKLTHTYGLANLSESTKTFELVKDNGFPVLNIFSWNVSFPNPENPYSQEGFINMTKIEPPVSELTAKQTSMGEEAVKLEWKLAQKALEAGAEVDSFQIFRFAYHDGLWDYGSLLISLKNLTPDSRGVYSYVDMGNVGLGLLPPSIGSVYKYNVAVTYKNNMKEKVDYCSYYSSPNYACLATTEELAGISFEMDVRLSYSNENTGKDFNYNVISVSKEDEIFIRQTFGGNQVIIPKLPEGKYSLTVNARGESWTVEDIDVNVSQLNEDDKIRVDIATKDNAHSTILKLNVLDKEGRYLEGTKIRSLKHEFIGTLSDHAHLLVLPKTEHRLVVSSGWYVEDTITFTMDTFFKELNITLSPNMSEAVYAFGQFNTQSVAFKDILGKQLAVKHRASGLIFKTNEAIGPDGKFAFDQVLTGDLEWLFGNNNLSLDRLGIISNEFYLSKTGDTVEIFKDEPFLDLKRIAFNIAGEIKFGQLNDYMTEVILYIRSSREERMIKFLPNDSPKFKLENFKENAYYNFEVQCIGYQTKKLNRRLSFRAITQRNDNTYSLGEDDLKLIPILRTAKVNVNVEDDVDNRKIKEVRVQLFTDGMDSVSSGLTDDNGKISLIFDDFINNGSSYLMFLTHPDYHKDSVNFSMYTDSVSFSSSLLKIPSYRVMVVSTDEKKGNVSGSGIYKLGSRVHVQAVPSNEFVFTKWGLGADTSKISGDASYSFILNQEEDIELRAYFEKRIQVEENALQILNIYTHKGLICIEGIQSPVNIEITDVSGRRLFYQNLSKSQCIPIHQMGLYLVRLSSDKASMLKKLIVR